MKKTALLAALALAAALPARAANIDPEEAARDLLTSLQKGQFPGAVCSFDDALRKAMPEARLASLCSRLVEESGRFEYFDPPRKERVGDAWTVRVLCVFRDAALDAVVGVDGGGKISSLSFVPAAKPPLEKELRPMPALFREREVTVGMGEWALPGTLTMPAPGGPCPAVVLLHGAGPRDRDELVGPNRPFRDLAWGLAARGIASLRYDKRTKAHPRALDPSAGRFTVDEETVDDALAAVRLLRRTEGVDPKKIFLAGQGFGGMLAPRIASRDRGIAGLILLCAPSRPVEDVLLARMEYFHSLDGEIGADEEAHLERLRKQVARAKDRALSGQTPSAELPEGLPASYWISLRGYDAPAEAARLVCPILVLQGGRDYQSTPEDFEGWKRALESRENAQLRWYPNLNRLFVSGTEKSTPAEFLQRRKSYEDGVLDEVAAWIKAR